MAVLLTLGPVLFADFEIPATISCGGQQVLVRHKLIGGARVIDAMGTDDDDIRWSGRFRGSDAETRAQYLEFLKDSGQQQTLQWSTYNYTVVVADVKIAYYQPYEIDYQITCAVVSNNLNPILTDLFTVDSAIGDLVNSAVQDAAGLGIPGVTSAVAAVASATGAVQTFEGVGSAVASESLGAISGAQSVVSGYQASADAVTASTGGLLAAAGASISSLTSGLTAQATAFAQAASLRNIGSSLGVTATNIANAI